MLGSFYNYLLYHRVCPEYYEDLDAARKLCDAAELELPKVNAAGLALPGDFNRSASAIFGGTHAGMYTGDKAWAEDVRKEGVNLDVFGIRDEEARIRFTTGVAILGSDEQYERLEKNTLKLVSNESMGLEVTAIGPPDDLIKSYYEEQSKMVQHKLGHLEALGKLACKVWYVEDSDEWDLPQDDSKYLGGKPCKVNNGKIYEFWMEESVLQHCFVGMKFDAKVLTLDGGLTILDDVNEAMCSFFTWLPNELWMERKPKDVRWLKKGLGLDEDEEVKEDGEKKSKAKVGSDDEFDDE